MKLGIGCTLAKTDVRSAFRIIPVHPKEYHLLGMKWRDEMEGRILCRLLSAYGTSKFL